MTTTRDQSLHDELLEEMFPPSDDLPTADDPAEEPANEEAAESQPDSDDEPTTEPPAEEPIASDRYVAERAALQRTIESTHQLPAAVRNRLSEAIQHATWNEAGEEQPTLTIGEMARWLEQSLPQQFALRDEEIEPREHPYGDSFFSGNAGGLDDRAANEIAAEQLAATGFARKQ